MEKGSLERTVYPTTLSKILVPSLKTRTIIEADCMYYVFKQITSS